MIGNSILCCWCNHIPEKKEIEKAENIEEDEQILDSPELTQEAIKSISSQEIQKEPQLIVENLIADSQEISQTTHITVQRSLSSSSYMCTSYLTSIICFYPHNLEERHHQTPVVAQSEVESEKSKTLNQISARKDLFPSLPNNFFTNISDHIDMNTSNEPPSSKIPVAVNFQSLCCLPYPHSIGSQLFNRTEMLKHFAQEGLRIGRLYFGLESAPDVNLSWTGKVFHPHPARTSQRLSAIIPAHQTIVSTCTIPGRSYDAIHSSGRVYGANEDSILAMFMDDSRSKDYDALLDSIDEFERVDERTVYRRYIYKPIWPTSAREFLMVTTWSEEPDGSLLLATVSPDPLIMHQLPLKSGCIRGQLHFSGSLSRPIYGKKPPVEPLSKQQPSSSPISQKGIERRRTRRVSFHTTTKPSPSPSTTSPSSNENEPQLQSNSEHPLSTPSNPPSDSLSPQSNPSSQCDPHSQSVSPLTSNDPHHTLFPATKEETNQQTVPPKIEISQEIQERGHVDDRNEEQQQEEEEEEVVIGLDLQMIGHSELNGSVPAFVVNMLSTSAPLKIFLGIKELFEKE